MKIEIEFSPKFNDVKDKVAATEAFVKHLQQGGWHIGSREADVSVFNVGNADRPNIVLAIAVPEAKIILG